MHAHFNALLEIPSSAALGREILEWEDFDGHIHWNPHGELGFSMRGGTEVREVAE